MKSNENREIMLDLVVEWEQSSKSQKAFAEEVGIKPYEAYKKTKTA